MYAIEGKSFLIKLVMAVLERVTSKMSIPC
jgi:hypothetical protein